MKPKIGIVLCERENQKQSVSDAYIQAIHRSGGLPFILPLVKSSNSIAAYTAFCDGFLFCGGNDITPLLFGQEPREGIRKTDIALDLFQIRLMKKVLESGKPVLAICRGIQILNVACGGTIQQDLFLDNTSYFQHMQHSSLRSEISHKITCTKGSILYKITGPYIFVNSFHHQILKDLGEGLVTTAVASDGAIEAVELPTAPFVMGLQWHPECMFRSSFEMRHLFSIFIQKSKKSAE